MHKSESITSPTDRIGRTCNANLGCIGTPLCLPPYLLREKRSWLPVCFLSLHSPPEMGFTLKENNLFLLKERICSKRNKFFPFLKSKSLLPRKENMKMTCELFPWKYDLWVIPLEVYPSTLMQMLYKPFYACPLDLQSAEAFRWCQLITTTCIHFRTSHWSIQTFCENKQQHKLNGKFNV